MGRLRITGVVKAMNQARERLSHGIPEDEHEQFREWVKSVIGGVEGICRQAGLAPNRLPGPTYRAYLYLKKINLQDLPAPSGAAPAGKTGRSGKRLRVSNLVAFCSQLHTRLAALALEHARQPAIRMPGTGTPAQKDALEALRTEIQAAVGSVESILQKENGSLQQLPPPTRRAFLWLKFLSEPQALASHLSCLMLAIQASQARGCRGKLSPKQRKLPIQVEIYNTPVLYRMRVQKGSIRITVNEGFIRAPERVILDLICAALSGNGNKRLSTVRAYTQDASFIQISRALENGEGSVQPDTRGQVYDLQEVFTHVNGEYFQGKLEQPNLTWNRTQTQRKLGHYQPATDTVMVSISLDRAEIPRWLLDYVMYHELLHKQLGIQDVNGRRYAHNRAFRAEERKFKQYTQVREFLRRMDAGL